MEQKENIKLNDVKEKSQSKNDKKEDEIKNTQEINEDTEKLEEGLQLDKGDIKSCTKLKLTGKDNLFKNKVPECKEYDSVHLVYVTSEDSFRFVGLKKGQPPKYLETIEPSQNTMKNGMDVDAETGDVEKKSIKGLMKFTGSKDYDFAVKIGQYGYIELNMLRKDPTTNKYMSTKLETVSQRPKERQEEVNKIMDKNKNTRINEEIDEFEKEKNENGVNTEVNINDISDKGRKVKQDVKEKLEEENNDERETEADEMLKRREERLGNY